MTDSQRTPLQAVKGMNDLLPPESAQWEWFEQIVRDLMQRYGYKNIRTPIVENTALFNRGLGEVTDIVEKEMYTFEDSLNGESLTLRPEGTAGVVRAVNEHSALYEGAKRLYYFGAMFRHEKPQKGRYRQFHQVGVEALGFAGPDVDVEVILMTAALWRDLGLEIGNHVKLQINTLGQSTERQAHRDALIAYFQQNEHALDEDSQRRLHKNPLRILDTKNPAMQALVEAAPKLIEFVGEESLAHFQAIQASLDANGIPYTINPRLVRGMDYYNLTVFEWVTERLGTQGTVCGGGRYDTLIEQLGGKPAPAVGWGLGVERLLLLLAELGLKAPAATADVYAVIPDLKVMPIALKTIEALRQRGVSVIMNGATQAGSGSIKSQFKRADGSGARWALIFGDNELANQQVACKPLREIGEQRLLALDLVDEWAQTLQDAR